MKTLVFFPNRNDLSVNINFFGFTVSAYALQIIDSDGQTPLLNPPISGVNVDAIPDIFSLPGQIEDYNGRFLELVISFIANDPENFPNFNIELELLQNGQVVGKDSRSGTLTGSVQRENITIHLKSN